MAMDSKQKRMAATGAGRPWMRAVNTGTLNASERASIGNTYPVASFGAGGGLTMLNFMRGGSRGFGNGFGRGFT